MRIAFYAPLKSPHHPTPSGDRSMARLLIKALKDGDHEVEVISELRSLEAAGDRKAQIAIENRAEQELIRLDKAYHGRAGVQARPELWFTYHHYYKAPDLFGPEMARQWGIPYVVAEASHAPKRLNGPWACWARSVEQTIRKADKVLALTGFDRVCLEPLVGPDQLVDFPPFLEAERFLQTPINQPVAGKPRQLLSVAMMRPGDKLESYRRLAEALARVENPHWRLTIAGDGMARPEVEALFGRWPGGQIRFLGKVGPPDLPALYAEADIFLWPGAGEAYGMVYLEAAASGLPVIAQAIRGVPDVVMDGRTGLLTADNDQTAFARSLTKLLENPRQCAEMGRAGRRFIAEERDLPMAAKRLNRIFADLDTGE